MKIIKELLLEWNRTGKNATALSYFIFAATGALLMALIGTVRLAGGYYESGTAYFILFAGLLCLALCVMGFIRQGRPERVNVCAYPLVVGGFVFGLTALFFLDGGMTSGVPALFILALAVTPWFLEAGEALVMLGLEILAYGANVWFAFYYPHAVKVNTVGDMGFLFPLLLVAGALGLMTLLSNYAYRHQQTRLDQAITDANAANEAKSAFLDNMSHEIRTPMNSILGMNEMILREEDRPEISEYALAVQRAGRALLGIINDILDFSKIQDNKMDIVPVRYDLSSLINDMVNITAEQAKKKSLGFQINIDKKIPRILDGDEYHIRQVMLNILNNAVKYTERGSVTLTLGYEPSGNDKILLKCSVSDTGIGIKTEDLEYIFHPFEHIEASRKFQSDGSGLGLTIVKNLLQLMGAELKVESVYRKGSTFSFDIPQKVIKWEPIGDYQRAFSMAASHQARYHESFQAPDARVLVVDDADVNLLVFTNLLKKTKIKIDTASSGVEMLQLVRMNHYNIIFLDHRMPGMDGIEAFHTMQKLADNLNAKTPVIALTANAVLGARQLYIDEGFTDYISKPVDTIRLEQLLIEYLPPELVRTDIPDDEEEENERNSGGPETPESWQKRHGFEFNFGMEEPAQEKEEEEPVSPYANIPGIDYDAAVTNCGTEETFVQALEIFYNTLDQKAGDIERFEKEKDIKNYTVLVHALKSAARLVGALQLSADAKYLEECGDKNDIAEIEARTPALLMQYRGYKETLAPIFGKTEEEDESLPEISVTELHELYGLIKGLAADFDLDNIDKMMEEAKGYRIPEAEKERFNKIKDCVMAADWGTLEQLLE